MFLKSFFFSYWIKFLFQNMYYGISFLNLVLFSLVHMTWWKRSLSQNIRTFWRRQCHHTSVLLPGKSHGRRSLVRCSLWGRSESDTTEWLHFHFSLSCIGEGNGNPLQYSCLENPRDGGAWWAAVSGVTQSRTRLKRLSSSSGKDLLGLLDMHLI